MNSGADQGIKNHDGSYFSVLWFVPFALAITGLTIYSCFKSIEYTLYDELDRQVTVAENLPLLLLSLICVLLLLKLLMTYVTPRIPLRLLPLLPLGICSAVSLYLIGAVRGLAVNDALTMDGITNAFMAGDYSAFTTPGGYLYAKSHQIGYLVYETLMYRLFGPSDFRAYQLFNLLAVLITLWLLLRITKELFPDNNTTTLACLLACGMLFLFVYTTHIYNDIISLPLQTAAMYLLLVYRRTGKLPYALLSALSLALSYMLKTNVLISTIAMVILLLLDALKKLQEKASATKTLATALLLSACLILLPAGLMGLIRSHYTHLAGITSFPKGEPMSTYVALGLQETDEGQSGWYNGYNARTFAENDYDHDRTDAVARKEVSRLIRSFVRDPAHAAYFFTKKFLTQWGDASCISMRNLELASRHVDEHSALVNTIIYGRGRTVCYQIMNVYQTLILLGCLIYCIHTIRVRSLPMGQSFLILFIFGGMLFHEFWEGSSRYTLRYYIFFLPFAAYGLGRLLQKIPFLQGKKGGTQ